LTGLKEITYARSTYPIIALIGCNVNPLNRVYVVLSVSTWY